MDEADERLRRLSSAVFGNSSMAHALLCADALTASGLPVTTRALARGLGSGDSTLRPVVLRLVAAGCLERCPSPTARKSSYRLAAPVGTAAAELAERLRGTACRTSRDASKV